MKSSASRVAQLVAQRERLFEVMDGIIAAGGYIQSTDPLLLKTKELNQQIKKLRKN